MTLINSMRKAIASGIATGAAAFASGATWPAALAAGIGAFAAVWAIPNAVTS